MKLTPLNEPDEVLLLHDELNFLNMKHGIPMDELQGLDVDIPLDPLPLVLAEFDFELNILRSYFMDHGRVVEFNQDEIVSLFESVSHQLPHEKVQLQLILIVPKDDLLGDEHLNRKYHRILLQLEDVEVILVLLEETLLR